MNINEVLVVIKTLQISQLLFPWAHDRTAFLFPLERGHDPGICRSRWCVSRVTEALRSSARFPMFSFSCCGDQEHSRDCQLFQPDSKIGWNLEQSPPWSWSGDGARLKTVFIPLKCGLSCCHSRAWTDSQVFSNRCFTEDGSERSWGRLQRGARTCACGHPRLSPSSACALRGGQPLCLSPIHHVFHVSVSLPAPMSSGSQWICYSAHFLRIL